MRQVFAGWGVAAKRKVIPCDMFSAPVAIRDISYCEGTVYPCFATKGGAFFVFQSKVPSGKRV